VRIKMDQQDIEIDIQIDDAANEPPKPQPKPEEKAQPKPLRKLVRVDRKAKEQQVYHGLHEAENQGDIPLKPLHKAKGEEEYHGKYEAEPEDDGKKPFSWVDLAIKIGSVAVSLIIIAVMILNMPIIWFNDKRDGTKKNVSVLYYLKNEQFLGHIEGNIDKTKNDPQINTDVVTPDYNDGLDLPQKVEGQFTLLFLGFDVDITNTDVMWVLEFDIRAGKLNILQIPRDTFMPDYTTSASGRANSIYMCGREDVNPPIQRVVDAVEQNFGIPIDAYVTTVCTDIVDMVDLIGGIPMHLDEEIVYEGGKVIPAGDIILDGQQAEWFIRFRHDWLEGDIGRVKNQRRFMAAAMKKLIDIADGGKGHTEIYKYLLEIYKHEWIATDMSVGDLTKLADFAGTLAMENVMVNMVPGEGTPNENLYVGPDGMQYSIYSIHKQATIDMLNKYYRPYQRKMMEMDTAIVELITEHAYDLYDDTGATLAELENSTEPPRN
jgi:LCP family protein required for cell wall assembly